MVQQFSGNKLVIMKKCFFKLALFVGAMTFVSCSNNDDNIVNENDEFVSFCVGTPSTETRTVVSGINTQGPFVNWETTDQLSLWGLCNNTASAMKQMTYTKKGNLDNYAYFTATSSFDVTPSKYYVLYPYQASASCSNDGLITAEIPNVQYAVADSFDPAAAICAGSAASQQTSVTLDHACTYLKIKTTKDCELITVSSSQSDWYIAGKVTIDAASAGAAIKSFPEGKNSVTLNPKSPATKIYAGTYLIAIASSTRLPGLTVTVKYDSSNSVSKTTGNDSQIQLASGTIYYLGTVPEN